MTAYRDKDLGDWEFKIMRSVMGAFKDPRVLQNIVQQESLGGWELLEKFDDERIRFRRPISARNNDATLPRGYDPYRTQVGISEGGLVLWIIMGIALVVGGVLATLAWYGLLD